MPIRRDPKTGKFAPNGGRKSSAKSTARKGANHAAARMKAGSTKKGKAVTDKETKAWAAAAKKARQSR